jgi:hypothetical protein
MAGRVTEPAEFRLVAEQISHVWLELLQSQDAGMRLAIRISHKKHDQKTKRTLKNAEVGRRFGLVLGDDGEGSEAYIDRFLY